MCIPLSSLVLFSRFWLPTHHILKTDKRDWEFYKRREMGILRSTIFETIDLLFRIKHATRSQQEQHYQRQQSEANTNNIFINYKKANPICTAVQEFKRELASGACSVLINLCKFTINLPTYRFGTDAV